MLQRAAFRLAGWQIIVTGFIAAGAGWLSGSESALSGVTGGGIGVIAGLYQALRMFRIDAAKSPESIMRGVYIGEALKILLTVALMIAAIRVLQVQFLPFMVGYIGTYVVYWAALNSGFPWINGPVESPN